VAGSFMPTYIVGGYCKKAARGSSGTTASSEAFWRNPKRHPKRRKRSATIGHYQDEVARPAQEITGENGKP
jgi:hypothetical protein